MLSKHDIIAINFSDQSIEAVTLNKNETKLLIKKKSRFSFSPGIIQESTIINKAKFKQIIKKLFDQASPQAMKSKYIAINIPESHVYIKNFTLKNAQKEDLDARISHYLIDEVPDDLDNLIYDYIIIKEENNDYQILWAGVSEKVIMSWYNTLEEMGLKLIHIELQSHSLYQICSTYSTAESKLIIDLGLNKTLISIFKNENLVYSSLINTAGNDLTDSIAQGFKIEWDKAESFKISYGLLPYNEAEDSLLPLIKKPLNDIKKEIETAIFWYLRNYNTNIDTIFLTGGTAKLKGLKQFLQTSFNQKIIIPSFYKEEDDDLFFAAIGLSMKANSKEKRPTINLYKQTLKKLKIQRRKDFKKRFWGKNKKIFSFAKNISHTKRLLIILIASSLFFVGIIGFKYLNDRTKEEEKTAKEKSLQQVYNKKETINLTVPTTINPQVFTASLVKGKFIKENYINFYSEKDIDIDIDVSITPKNLNTIIKPYLISRIAKDNYTDFIKLVNPNESVLPQPYSIILDDTELLNKPDGSLAGIKIESSVEWFVYNRSQAESYIIEEVKKILEEKDIKVFIIDQIIFKEATDSYIDENIIDLKVEIIISTK